MTGSLMAILDRYPTSIRPTATPTPLGNAGGLSGANLWRFESAGGMLVARCWPADGQDLDQLRLIHSWMAAAADLGFVPVPITTRDGRSIVANDGRLWEVDPWMPGAADLNRPPSSEHLRAAFSGLAAFHARISANRSEGPSPGLGRRLEEIDRLVSGEAMVMREAIGRAGDDPRALLACKWLDRAIKRAPGLVPTLRKSAAHVLPLQPCLRDARPDHFLLEDGRLTGLVDFGAMGIDSVAADLARLLAEGVGPDHQARAEAMAAYESVRRLSDAESASIASFERANAILGAARWVRWHFLEHRVFRDPLAVTAGLKRGLERLDEAVF